MSKTIELEKVNEIIDEEIYRIEGVQLTDEHEDTICILLDIKQKLQPTPSDPFDRVYREEDLNEVFYSISIEQEYTSEWYKKTITTNEKSLLNTLLKLGFVCSTRQGAERLLKAHINLANIQAFARELNRKSGYVVDWKNSFQKKWNLRLYYGVVTEKILLDIDLTTHIKSSTLNCYVGTEEDIEELKKYITDTLKLTQQDLEDIMYL